MTEDLNHVLTVPKHVKNKINKIIKILKEIEKCYHITYKNNPMDKTWTQHKILKKDKEEKLKKLSEELSKLIGNK